MGPGIGIGRDDGEAAVAGRASGVGVFGEVAGLRGAMDAAAVEPGKHDRFVDGRDRGEVGVVEMDELGTGDEPDGLGDVGGGGRGTRSLGGLQAGEGGVAAGVELKPGDGGWHGWGGIIVGAAADREAGDVMGKESGLRGVQGGLRGGRRGGRAAVGFGSGVGDVQEIGSRGGRLGMIGRWEGATRMETGRGR